MKQKRKNRVFEFICAFLPGAAEMYNGFIKSGVSIMGLFFGMIWILSITETMLAAMAVGVIYFFGFFHARNLAHTTDEEFFALEDRAIWEEMSGFRFGIKEKSVRIVVSVVLILTGISMLWNMLMDIILPFIPDVIWDNFVAPLMDGLPKFLIAIVVIVVGLRLIRGKKEEAYGIEDKQNA